MHEFKKNLVLVQASRNGSAAIFMLTVLISVMHLVPERLLETFKCFSVHCFGFTAVFGHYHHFHQCCFYQFLFQQRAAVFREKVLMNQLCLEVPAYN